MQPKCPLCIVFLSAPPCVCVCVCVCLCHPTLSQRDTKTHSYTSTWKTESRRESQDSDVIWLQCFATESTSAAHRLTPRSVTTHRNTKKIRRSLQIQTSRDRDCSALFFFFFHKFNKLSRIMLTVMLIVLPWIEMQLSVFCFLVLLLCITETG